MIQKLNVHSAQTDSENGGGVLAPSIWARMSSKCGHGEDSGDVLHMSIAEGSVDVVEEALPDVEGVLACLCYARPDVELFAYGCVCVMLVHKQVNRTQRRSPHPTICQHSILYQ